MNKSALLIKCFMLSSGACMHVVMIGVYLFLDVYG